MLIGSIIYPIRSLPDVVGALRHALNAAIYRGERGFDPARRGILYRPDPVHRDRLQFPSELLRAGAGDCEELALALALDEFERNGWADFDSGFFIPGEAHVWVRTINGPRDPSIECARREHCGPQTFL